MSRYTGNKVTPQNFATSSLSPFASYPKSLLSCLKTQNNCGFKGFKVAHHFFLGNIEVLWKFQSCHISGLAIKLKECWEVAWTVTGWMQRCATDQASLAYYLWHTGQTAQSEATSTLASCRLSKSVLLQQVFPPACVNPCYGQSLLWQQWHHLSGLKLWPLTICAGMTRTNQPKMFFTIIPGSYMLVWTSHKLLEIHFQSLSSSIVQNHATLNWNIQEFLI